MDSAIEIPTALPVYYKDTNDNNGGSFHGRDHGRGRGPNRSRGEGGNERGNKGRGHGRGRGGRGRGKSTAGVHDHEDNKNGGESQLNQADKDSNMKPGKKRTTNTLRSQCKSQKKLAKNQQEEAPTRVKISQTSDGINAHIQPAEPARHESARAKVTQKRLTRSTFFTLPGEIRSKIYEDAFDTYRVEIVRAKPLAAEGQKQRYRLYHKNLQLRDHESHLLVSRESTSPPLALALTCFEIYLETLLYIYSNTHFVFTSPKAIRMFLKRTGPLSQSAIHHIELRHIMYNEPILTEHRIYKCLSDMRWYLTCGDMSDSFTSLKELHLDLAIADWPIRLNTGEQWAAPLRFFRNLNHVNVKLRMSMFREEKLQTVARQLERKLMTPEAFQLMDDERVARKLQAKMGIPKAAKVLKITF